MASSEKSRPNMAPSDSGKSVVSNEERDTSTTDMYETVHPAQKLEKNFSLLSICAVGIVTGNTWACLGGSIVVALYNGGPTGLLYEFIAVSVFYWLIAASLAEMASSMPSSAGVYLWASMTAGPRYGRVCGWFAGWWNFLAWNLGAAAMASIMSNICVGMYGVYHPDYVPRKWHVLIGYLVGTWLCCSVVLFANRALPMINTLGLFFVLGGVFITILVCAIMPTTAGSGHAYSSFVWSDWTNQTGYASNSFVFLAGMLNGAYAVGTPDCVSHLAEEIPRPQRNIPLAIAAQMAIGFLTAVLYMVAIFYSISNLDDVFAAPTFPLAVIYRQATSSNAGTMGLLLVIFLPIVCTTLGSYITAGRTLWTLARDRATPFPKTLDRLSPRFKNPFNATLACGVSSTLLGCVYVGSSTAFNAFVGSFVVLSTLSYLAAILPFVLNRRFSPVSGKRGVGLRPGPYHMSPILGYVVNILSCLYIVVFIVIYSFPFSIPVTAGNMNYSCLITGVLTLLVGLGWMFCREEYVGPQALLSLREV